MRQRLAIAISGLVAAAVLAVGLTAAGFGPEPRSAAAGGVEAAAAVPTVEEAEPEIVYIQPAPKPRTVVVRQRVEQQGSGTANESGEQARTWRSGDDDDDESEHRRESAEERREHEREDHEREDEDDDD